MSDRDFTRVAYIGLESLRNAADLIGKHIGSWAATRIKFVVHEGPEWERAQRLLWDTLDVEPDMAGMLQELQLRFCDGSLYVSMQLADSPDLVGKVVGTLRLVWRFSKWTERRWLTVGSSANTLVAGLFIDWYPKAWLTIFLQLAPAICI